MVIGVLHEALDQNDLAMAAYARAEELYDSRATFLAMRAQQYEHAGLVRSSRGRRP